MKKLAVTMLTLALLLGLGIGTLASGTDGDSVFGIELRPMALSLSNPDSQTFFKLGSTELLNADRFDFGDETGYQINLSFYKIFKSAWDLELSYIPTVTFTAGVDPIHSSGGALWGNPEYFGNTNYAADVFGSYESKLKDNAEINFIRPVNNWFGFLVGYRALNIDETCILRHDVLASSVNHGSAKYNTQNKLQGPQVGALIHGWPESRFGLDFSAKAGWLRNNAKTDALFVDMGTSYPSKAIEANNDSLLKELALAGRYNLTDNSVIRLGYQWMSVEDIALATRQFPVTYFNTPSNTKVDNDGENTYQGAFLSLTFKF